MADIGETMFTDIETPAHEDSTSGPGATRAYLFDGWNFTPMVDEQPKQDDEGQPANAARAAA